MPEINLNRLNSQGGSASILVIMLSLTLVVFGVFSMMAAHAGLAVARRHGEWNTKYHQVESEAALITAEIHQLAIGEAMGFMNSADEKDLSDQGNTIIQLIEKSAAHKRLPVTITKSVHTTEAEEVVFQAEINIVPPLEDRNGFYGDLLFRIDLSNKDHPGVTVEKTAWKSVTDAFEYKEGVEFRDVEVEVQVE